MKINLLSLLLSLSLISCAKRETTYGWDKYDDDQKTAIQSRAQANCLNTKTEIFDTISKEQEIHFKDIGSADIYVGANFTLKDSSNETSNQTNVTVIRIGESANSDADTIYFLIEANTSFDPLQQYKVVDSTDLVIKYTLADNKKHLEAISIASCATTTTTNSSSEKVTIENSSNDILSDFKLTLQRDTLIPAVSEDTEDIIQRFQYVFPVKLNYPTYFMFFTASFTNSELDENENQKSTTTNSYSLSKNTTNVDVTTNVFINKIRAANRCAYASYQSYVSVDNIPVNPLTLEDGNTFCKALLYTIEGFDN
jgi:hypothetical protein